MEMSQLAGAGGAIATIVVAPAAALVGGVAVGVVFERVEAQAGKKETHPSIINGTTSHPRCRG